MPSIIWLASYPKSGNTWLRIFLTNFWNDTDEPVDINDLRTDRGASNREQFDDAVGVESSDLTPDEIDCLQPDMYRQIAEERDRTLFIKIHDALTYTSEGRLHIPEDVTTGAIYLIRNPLDVAVSFAHHSGASIDRTIARMVNESHALSPNFLCLDNQLRQQLLSWGGHVLSWVDAPGIRVFPVRYEDMQFKPLETFILLVRFAGLPVDTDRIQKAIELSSFQRVQQQERDHGFQERHPRAESFFRRGKVGSWREVLTPEQVNRIIEDHYDVMRRFGYLTASGEIVY
jgi:hypothetical protein